MLLNPTKTFFLKYLAYISNLFSLKGSDLIFHRALCDKLPSKYRDQDISFLITAASSKIEAHSLSFPAACFSIFSYLQGDSQSVVSGVSRPLWLYGQNPTTTPQHSFTATTTLLSHLHSRYLCSRAAKKPSRSHSNLLC